MNKLYIIGIGYKPLEERARDIVLKSSVIIANHRLLEIFKGYNEFKDVKDKIKVINNPDEIVNFLKYEIKKLKIISLLSSGDPMFHGIGRRVVNEFGKDIVEIFPDLSSVQIAFSRIKEPWDDAFLVSLHRAEENEYKIDDIPFLLKTHNKIAILTNEKNNPITIAEKIKDLPITMYVFERLGMPSEKIIEGIDNVLKMEFKSPNVVILQKNG